MWMERTRVKVHLLQAGAVDQWLEHWNVDGEDQG